MNYDNLQKYIENLYFNTPETIHGISLGYKIKDGITTDKLCISFFVPKKLEEKDLENQYIIPKSIVIQGTEYLTDVVETKMPIAIGCFNWQADPLPPEIIAHRSRQRPVKGGIIISNYTDLYNPLKNSIVKGTLGLICVDKDTDSFVGLTNAHVIIKDPFVPSNQDVKGVLSNILPDKKIVQYTEPNINVTNDDIGNIRKFYPLSKDASNYIDAALISIKEFVDNTSTTILSQTESWRQLGLNYNNPMEFASTQEIDSLLNTPREIYSAGRTTGPKGSDCPLQITNLLSSYSIIYEEQGTRVSVPFSNCITFKYQDNSLWSTAPGDSGSVLIANFNGAWKIIGLVFAGDEDGSFGVACRIDTIANRLNIEPWLNGNKNYIQNYKTVLKTFDEGVSLMSNNNSNLWNVTQTIDGDKYWYAGLLSDSSSSSSSSSSISSSSSSSSSISSSSSSSSSNPPIFNTSCTPCCPAFTGSWAGGINGLGILRNCTSELYACPTEFDECLGGLVNYTVEALYLHSYDPTKFPESASICSGTVITGTNSIQILTPYSPSNFIPQNAPDFSGIAILPSLQGSPINVDIRAILKPGGTPLIDLSNDNITFGQNTTITIPANELSGLFVVRVTGVLPPDNPNVPGNNDPAEIFLEASVPGNPLYDPSLTLLTIYPGESGVGNGAPCGGPGHVCNRALFDVIIGTGLDPVTSGVDGIVVLNANLNNGGGSADPGPGPAPYDGPYDRYSSGIITEAMAQQIFGASYNDGLDKSYFVEIKPAPGNVNPHNGITNVRIRDCSGILVYNCCLSIGGGTTFPPPPPPSSTSSVAFSEILSFLMDEMT